MVAGRVHCIEVYRNHNPLYHEVKKLVVVTFITKRKSWLLIEASHLESALSKILQLLTHKNLPYVIQPFMNIPTFVNSKICSCNLRA